MAERRSSGFLARTVAEPDTERGRRVPHLRSLNSRTDLISDRVARTRDVGATGTPDPQEV